MREDLGLKREEREGPVTQNWRLNQEQEREVAREPGSLGKRSRVNKPSEKEPRTGEVTSSAQGYLAGLRFQE